MDVTLPHLGEGADSGTVVNLFVKEGDRLSKDQPILELENEKAVATIPSSAEGTIRKVFVRAGEKISVGQRILALDEAPGGKPAKAEAGPKPRPEAGDRPQKTPVSPPEKGPTLEAQHPELKPGQEPAAAPSIRKMARDLGIDLTRVRGSESGGRIVLEDLRKYIQGLQGRAGVPPSLAGAGESPGLVSKPAPEQVDFSKWGPISTEPLSTLRQVIARRMVESWTAVPRVTQFDEADITNLNELRKKYSTAYEQKGARLTLTSFALKVTSDALKRHPLLNASLDESAQQTVMKQYIHIGVAVDTEAGLIVPVLRDADKKDILTLSKELEDLAQRARSRKISADELKGGTFTISNQGGIGSGHFTPIVNKPEVAILGLGRGALKAVVRQGRIEPRLMLPLALSYDHRLIDGAQAARFVVDLVKAFETFNDDPVRL